MKNILIRILVLVPFIFFGNAMAQTYTMTNGSISACSGTFYDPGGTGNYGNSQTFVYTICPSTPGAKVIVNFTSFNLENSFDFLQVFDGNSTAAPSLGTYTGTAGPGLATASVSNATGCLTFRFTSDGSVTYAGWVASISCSTPCQTITANLTSTTPAATSGIVKICQGGSVSFTGSGTFSGSSTGAVYTWNFGDGTTGTGTTVSHTYPTAGSYQASLSINVAGCTNNNLASVIVQVSTTPTITTTATPTSICLGQSANLSSVVTMTPYVPNCTPPVSGTTFLPDGSGVSYSTAIAVNCFNAGQTITAASNISNVCLTMEHSYLGDLNIVLICPNGQSMILKSYANGGNGTYLGSPLDDPATGPGTGATYCFTPTATTLLVNGGTVTAGSPAGNSIAPGNYMPTNPFTNLIGCPLNGNWTIQVTDNLGADNGYIFNWDVNFTVAAAAGGFTPTIASQGWTPATGLASTGTTTATVTPTATGSQCYNYFVTDNFGCTYNHVQCVTVNPNTPVNAGADVTICTGGSTTLTASGASTYTWSPATGLSATTGATVTATPAATTTYTVTGTSASGCVTTDQVIVTVSAPPTVNAGVDQEVCAGGSATLTATGATTYTWSPATGLSATTGATVTANPAATITYTVTGTTAGCTASDQIVVTVNPVATGNANIDQTVCAGGTVTLAGTVGGSATTGTWSAPSGTFSNASSLTSTYTPTITSGTVTLTLTTNDPGGPCSAVTDIMIVTVNPLPIVNAGADISICSGGSTTLNATGATTYSWAPGGQTTASITVNPTATTTYTVTGTTAGCISTDQVVVTVNPLPTVNAGVDQSICIGASVTLSGSGAATYTWNNGVTNGVAFAPTATTTYTITGTDVNGCINSDQVIVTVNPLPTVNAGLDQTVCAGVSVTLAGSGASTYSWNNGVTNGVAFTPSATTTFTVTGTDVNGCVNTDQVLVTVNPIPVVNAGADVSICAGGSTTLAASGATTYSWSPGGQTTSSITVSPAATTTYTVIGTSLGCTSSDVVTVTILSNAAINAGPDVAICTGASTTLTATGGVTYTWNNGLGTGNGFSVSPTATTTYTVIGTDANGCIGADAVTISVNPLPTVNAGLDQTICVGANVTLSGSGASTYTWNNGVTNGVAFAPAATTTYTVTGTTAAGCINTDQVVVTVNPLPIVNAGVDQTICVGASVTLSGSGAATYTWNNGVTNGVAFAPATTTTYTVTGTSAAGCINTDQVVVTVNPLPTVNAGADQTICVGASVTLSGSGAATYSWNNGVVNGVAFAPVATTTYTVTGTDANGCINTDQVVVTVNPLPIVNAGPDVAVCIGGSVTLTGSGAATYSWSGGITNGVAFAPSATATYTLTGTSAAGCINTDQVVVTVNPLPLVNAGPDISVCTATAVTLNGSGASIYVWSGGITNGVAFTPAATTTYTLTGTDVNGCVNTDAVTVTVLSNAPINAGPDVALCAGSSITLTATGGVTYAWNNGVTNGVAFTPAATTTYTVVGTDAAGCTGTDAITVTVNPLPIVNAGADQTVCAGTAVTLTATGAATYSWTGGITNGVAFTPSVTTTYTVTGTTAAGCTATDAVLVTVNPLPIVNAGADQTVCAGTAVTLNGSGAATYSWTGGITNGVAFTPAATTTYTVTGTTAAGCTATDAVLVTVNPLPIVNAGADQTVCAGTGVTLTATGAATYSWDNGVTNGVGFTPVVGTVTYTVTGTTAAGCTATDQVTVTVNPMPVPVINGPTSYCAGYTATLGTNVPYTTYAWSTGASTPTINATIANNPITVTVTNGFGCSAISPSVTLTENAVITANFTVTICQGQSALIHGVSQSVAGLYSQTYTTPSGCDSVSNVTLVVNALPAVNAGIDQAVCTGTATTLTATGAATYVWNNGITNSVPFTQAIGSTTYTVTGTDANGCVNTDQAIITVNALPVVNAGVDQALCIGASATLSGSGASTYTWNNGVTNAVAFAPSITNTYTVTGTDVNGCINTDQVVVTVNPLPAVNAGADQVTCIGGTVTLSGSGATSYSWNNGVTNGVAFAPAATTTYTVTGTDANGCINTDQVLVTVNTLPTVNAGPDQTVCIGTAVTLTGTGAATYSWDNGVNQGVAFTPAVGTVTYTVTGTSGPGCIATDQVNVTVNALPIVNAGADQALCIGASATLSGSGAATYTWNNGVTNATAFTPALTNTYTVTGTDANGCINTDQVVVTVNPLPLVNAGADQVICIGATVTLSGSGASNYTWNNGVTNAVAFSPAATTTYTVTGTDVNGCINTDQVLVTVNTLPVVNAGPDQTVCVGTAVTLTGTGASTYSWDNGVNNGVAFTPGVGTITYTVTGTSGASCIATDQVVVTVNALPVVNAGVDQALCIGASATISGSGATTYTWNNGVTNGVAFTPAATNTYTVTGTDANGCINTDQVVVTVHTLPVVDAGIDQAICAGNTTTLFGAMPLSVGGSTFTWNNGVTNGVAFIPAATNTYTVTGTDVNGCTNTDQVVVTVNALPIVNAGNDLTLCQGSTATLTATGASTYSWNNGVNQGVAFSPAVGATTYSVTGTSGAGCVATDQVVVTVNALPIVDAGMDQVLCAATNVTLSGSGATTYTWNNGVTNGVAFTPAATTTYTVTGTDANGCINTDQVQVTVGPIPVVFAGNDVTLCDGQSVTLTASGATTYTWNNGVTNGVTFAPAIGSVVYSVTGTNAFGCIATDQVSVTVNPLPTVSFVSDVTTGCVPLVVNFTNTTPGATACNWSIENGSALTGCGTVQTTFNQSGCFDVTLTTTGANGCVNNLTVPNFICVEENPIASFTPQSAVLSTLNTTVEFNNTSIGAVDYLWNFDDESMNSTIDSPNHTFPEADGNYNVQLIATSSLGCVDTAYGFIQVQEELLYYVPNSFTPDMDDYNEIFKPIFTSGFDPYDYTLLIYNRWGEIIFESHNAEIGWDGTYGVDGELVQDGTYTWTIEFKRSINDAHKQIQGHVNVLR